ncbi:hypothetical protein [uncultured Sphingomonas sp.]|uniref:hypothetical protein n=1 Tax=uncultured Sphingomonas sp. TaxID=158754 RepID=UPI0025FFEDDF|nr:hypothetical protein [uncultured Sphingomonas sp.]
MAISRILRVLALVVLGTMMLVRMGPVCEAMAQAVPAPGLHAAMSDCDRVPAMPQGKPASIACPGACIATDVDAPIVLQTLAALSPAPPILDHEALVGRSGGPSPPPPRRA